MGKRIAAALVVASTICWSLAPVSSSLVLRASRSNNVKSVSTHQHDCCPHGKKPTIPVMLAALSPATMPCGDQHPCCIQQAPDRSPALPVAKADSRPDSTNFTLIVASASYGSSLTANIETPREPAFESALPQSTVLRI